MVRKGSTFNSGSTVAVAVDDTNLRWYPMFVITIFEGHISIVGDFRVNAYVLVCLFETEIIGSVSGSIGSHEGVYENLHSNDINSLIDCNTYYINIKC